MQCVVGFFHIQRSKHQKYLQQVYVIIVISPMVPDQMNIFPRIFVVVDNIGSE